MSVITFDKEYVLLSGGEKKAEEGRKGELVRLESLPDRSKVEKRKA